MGKVKMLLVNLKNFFPDLSGVFRRLLLLFLTIGIIPLVISVQVIIYSFEKEQVRLVLDQITSLGEQKTREVERFLRERINDIIVLSSNPDIKAGMIRIVDGYRPDSIDALFYRNHIQKFDAYLAKYIDLLEIYDLFFITIDGDVAYSVRKESDLGTNLKTGQFRDSELAMVWEYSRNFLAASISKIDYYVPSDGDFFFISAPVFSDNRLAGIIAIQVEKKKIISAASGIRFPGNTGDVLLGRLSGGKLIIDSSFERISDIEIGSGKAMAMQRAVTGSRGRGVTFDHRGRSVIAAWNYLPDIRAAILFQIDREEAIGPVSKIRKFSYIFLAVVTLVVMVAAYVFSLGLVHPLRQMTNLSKKIAEGDYHTRIEYENSDEVGTLARSFNSMADQLLSTMQELGDSRLKLLMSHQELEKKIIQRTAELQDSNVKLRDEIQERIKAEGQRDLASKVVENTSEGVVITDINGTIIDVNNAFCKITGFSRDDAVGKNPRISKSGKHGTEFYRDMWNSLLTTGTWQGEIWDRRKDGTIYPKWLTINVISDESSHARYYVGIFKDISQIKETQQELNRLAFFDPLTALPNRLLFFERLRQAIYLAPYENKKVAVFFMDLNRFKYINDTLGHTIGDEVLKVTASRLLTCVRESDTVARLGGDEYTLIISNFSSVEELAEIADNVIHKVSKPIQIQDRDLYVNAAIGISVFPDNGDDVETLVKNADMAMYRAKSDGSGAFYFYSTEMNALGKSHLEMETMIRVAIENSDFSVFYQPIFRTQDQRLASFEALVRWNHRERGFIPPDSFIPVAEETGLIVPIEDSVLEMVARQIREWKTSGLKTVPVAINVSPVQFRNKLIFDKIGFMMEKYDITPDDIEFELTERILMDESDSVKETFRMLRDRQIRFSLDDFGTGFSSLSYLNKFDVFKLKIDRSFTSRLPDDYKSSALTRAILSLSKSLFIEVVAEGVENEAQLAYFANEKCDYVQGYLMSKPVPPGEAVRFMEKV